MKTVASMLFCAVLAQSAFNQIACGAETDAFKVNPDDVDDVGLCAVTFTMLAQKLKAYNALHDDKIDASLMVHNVVIAVTQGRFLQQLEELVGVRDAASLAELMAESYKRNTKFKIRAGMTAQDFKKFKKYRDACLYAGRSLPATTEAIEKSEFFALYSSCFPNNRGRKENCFYDINGFMKRSGYTADPFF